jgi:zinc-binding alcohol dehydrogenase/oxidoreductase
MHAVVMHEFGAAAVLRPGEFPDPAARPGWVTVALRASALNWHDVLVRQGRYRSPLPHIIGADGAGVRSDTGEKVELVSVPADCVAPKPAGMSWAEAAALPLVGVTTYRALFVRGRLRSGESMLVVGAGGGIATMAISLAVAAGAAITVTSSSPDTIERAVSAGARSGVLHGEAGWPEHARAMSPNKAGFDLVLDPVGRWSESVRTLRPGGRLVVLGANAAETAPMDVRSFYFGQFDLLGTTMGSSRDFAGLLNMIDRCPVRPPVIDREFPLDRAAEAHQHLEHERTFGKCVLTQD